MNLEQKIEYYNRYYGDIGLPNEVKTIDFFNEEFLDYLLKYKYKTVTIKYIDFEELLRNPSLFNKTVQLLFNYNLIEIDSSNFYELLINNKTLFDYVSYSIINNTIALYFNRLLKDNRTLELLKPLSKTNPSFFIKILNFVPNDMLKEMLKDPVWKKIYMLIDYDKFFSDIRVLGVDNIGIDDINEKINSLNYYEIIKVLTKYYDITNCEPNYLQETYKLYENEIRKHKIGKILEELNENSSDEIINKSRELINSNIGMEVFLSSFKLDKFEKISKILGLNPEIKNMRKNCFLQILNHYEDYNLDTVKNVFSLYYFEEISSNIIIDIGVILKYANSSDEAKKILGTLSGKLEIIYNYLTGNQNINPIEIMNDNFISGTQINEILNKMYNLFNQDINKNTASEVVLKNATSEEKNGVVIYHLDNTNDGMFLIHSISVSDENYHKEFFDKAKNYSKICMSLLDVNHTKTFLGGIVFGYLDIQNPLYSATVSDGQTNQRTSLLRQYNSDLMPINQFMNNTDQNSYNELAYLTNNKPVMPSYILCIDREPNDLEIKIAKDFEIPIYVYPKREVIIELPNEQVEHKPYDYETSRIQIIPKNLSKDKIITTDNITFSETNTHKL